MGNGEEADERALVLVEAAALRKSAMDYMQPEVGVATTDAACSRNYFNRYSAAETEDCEDEVASDSVEDARLWLANERAEVLAEAAALKKSAMDYLHPEVGVAVRDATCGRNYFNRPSAPEVESGEDADERALVLVEAAALRKSAMDYMQPEVGVATTDAACSRNYFNRYSAAETDDCEGEIASDSVEDARLWLANERAEGLAEAMALKKSAVDYTSPEVGVTSVAGACFGRNYFDRYSAPETEEDDLADECSEVLAEAAALKNLAAAVKGA